MPHMDPAGRPGAGGGRLRSTRTGATRSISLTLPATAVAGTRTWRATVLTGGSAVALLAATATVSASLEVTGNHAVTDGGTGVLRLRIRNNGASAKVLGHLDYALGVRTGSSCRAPRSRPARHWSPMCR